MLPTRSVTISFAPSLNRDAEPECLGATGAINAPALRGVTNRTGHGDVGGVLAGRDGLAAEAARKGGLRHWNGARVTL
jgi:hypothetical protein